MRNINIENKIIDLIDIVILFISQLSIISVLALHYELFRPIPIIIISISLLIAEIIIFRFKTNNIKLDKSILIIVIILSVGLILRLSPYIYLSGGQDQGLYINMSKSFENEGDWFPNDEFRETLNNGLQQLYDENRTGIYPGINIRTREESEYVMPFYPLFPSLMAITSKLFGSDNRVWILTIFSLLTIFMFYKLTFLLTSDKKAGYLAALLLAINPLHVFFSKFPSTEVVALGFIIFTSYYLIKYYKNAHEGKYQLFTLVLSALTLTCFYITRLSFFIYVPIIYGIIILALLSIEDKLIRKHTLVYFYMVCGGIIFGSLIYTNFAKIELFEPALESTLVPILGNNYLPGLIALGIILFISVHLIYIFQVKLPIFFKNNYRSYLPLFFLLCIVAIIILTTKHFYDLGFTDIFTTDIKNTVWHMVGNRYGTIRYLSIIVSIAYISPFIVTLAFIGIFKYIKKVNIYIVLLSIITVYFIVFTVFYVKDTQYHYYYARYYITEVVPFTLIIGSIFTMMLIKESNKFLRYGALVLLVLGIIYSSYYSIIQFNRYEGGDPEFFENLHKQINQNDIVLVNTDQLFPSNEILTPLVYYYENKLFQIKNDEELNYFIANYSSELDNKFVVLSMVPMINNRLWEEEKIRFKYEYFSNCNRHLYSFMDIQEYKLMSNKYLCKNLIIPTEHYKTYKDLYIYKVKKDTNIH